MIRRGLQGASAEVELKKGTNVKVTTDASFNEKGSAELIYVDYVNICRVVSVGSRVFVDDGLISLIVRKIGMTELVGCGKVIC